jgi:hypothetical protein
LEIEQLLLPRVAKALHRAPQRLDVGFVDRLPFELQTGASQRLLSPQVSARFGQLRGVWGKCWGVTRSVTVPAWTWNRPGRRAILDSLGPYSAWRPHASVT